MIETFRTNLPVVYELTRLLMFTIGAGIIGLYVMQFIGVIFKKWRDK